MPKYHDISCGAATLKQTDEFIGLLFRMHELNMKINFEELDFGESQIFQLGAIYKNIPFTGIAYELDGANYFEWNYLDGKAHGRWYGINTATDQLLYDEWYVTGMAHGEFKAWAKNGALTQYTKFDQGTIKLQKIWNDSHILIKFVDSSANINEEYYDDGSLYLRKTKSQINDKNNQIKWFLGNEDKWLATNLGYDQEKKTNVYKFNSELLVANLGQLSSVFHDLIVLQFTRYLIQNERESAFIFLSKLSNHQDDWFRSEAAYFLGELGNRGGILYLKRLAQETANPFVRDRFGFRRKSHIKSIGERAKLAIQKIEQSEKS